MFDCKSVLRGASTVTALLTIGYLALGIIAFRTVRGGGSPALPELLHAALDLPAGAAVGPTLIFVFSLRDCSDALRLGRLWNRLHGSGRVRVRGVVIDPPDDPRELRRFLVGHGIRFPVRAADRRLLHYIDRLGHTRTPVTLLTDAGGRLRLAIPGLQDSLAQLARVRLLEAELAVQSRPGRPGGVRP